MPSGTPSQCMHYAFDMYTAPASTQGVPVLVSAHAHQLLKRPGKMGGIRITDGLADLPDLQAGVGQHDLCLVDADGVENIIKALSLVPVEQFG